TSEAKGKCFISSIILCLIAGPVQSFKDYETAGTGRRFLKGSVWRAKLDPIGRHFGVAGRVRPSPGRRKQQHSKDAGLIQGTHCSTIAATGDGSRSGDGHKAWCSAGSGVIGCAW